MSKQANPAIIGGFVVGALTILVLALILFGGGALLRERVAMVTFFPGSVQGLSVGAPVLFEGVTVGRVTGIELSFSPSSGSFRVPVFYEVWPERVHILGSGSDGEAEEILRRLVTDHGLHARLESLSFVTGQYVVALQMWPGRMPRLSADQEDLVEVPALEATRDRVTEMIENLRIEELVNETAMTFAAIRRLFDSGELTRLLATLQGAAVQTETLMAHLDRDILPLAQRVDRTLADYARLADGFMTSMVRVTDALEGTTADIGQVARRLDARIDPLAGSTMQVLGETEAAMRAIRELAEDATLTRDRLDELLREASATVRSLRSLADQLDRHPESLLRGRR
ncbi:MAG: MCE family protein [Sphingobacteriia bacterium]|nr:MCE family protein [Sphingobacteriia bacterium]NCC41098.1 MCE family protein [Gammaproteobacteria bacterium]